MCSALNKNLVENMKNMRSLIVLIGAMSALLGAAPAESVQLVSVQKLNPQELYEKFLRLDLEEHVAKIVTDCDDQINNRIASEAFYKENYAKHPEKISDEVFQRMKGHLQVILGGVIGSAKPSRQIGYWRFYNQRRNAFDAQFAEQRKQVLIQGELPQHIQKLQQSIQRRLHDDTLSRYVSFTPTRFFKKLFSSPAKLDNPQPSKELQNLAAQILALK
jgi:hypothetical protein